MPKLKTNKATRKRYKISARGKVMMPKTGRRHLLTDKSSGQKRKLRGWEVLHPTDQKRVGRLLPYR